MITIAQCRAARGLLEWTQEDLAQATGLSKTSINNYEKGKKSIREDNLQRIYDALFNHGIRFQEDNGVSKPPLQTHINFHGTNYADKVIEQIQMIEIAPHQNAQIFTSADFSALTNKLSQAIKKHNVEVQIIFSESNQCASPFDTVLIYSCPHCFFIFPRLDFFIYTQTTDLKSSLDGIRQKRLNE